MDETEFACGCFKENGGICQTAQHLWQQVLDTRKKYDTTGIGLSEYAEAHQKYYDHFKEQREMAEVG